MGARGEVGRKVMMGEKGYNGIKETLPFHPCLTPFFPLIPLPPFHMLNRKPEGYKDLLAYQKAAELQELTLKLTALFPAKFNWLKEQMDKSGRSGTKNIIEGWKRNTTPEYFTFLGYSIAAIEELKDDCADIAKGLYPPLFPFKPFTETELTGLRFYPLDPSLPPAVHLYLRAKEVLMLLHKLQQSLDQKMDRELTKPGSDRARRRISQFQNENQKILNDIETMGLVRLEDGRFVTKTELEKLQKQEKGISGGG